MNTTTQATHADRIFAPQARIFSPERIFAPLARNFSPERIFAPEARIFSPERIFAPRTTSCSTDPARTAGPVPGLGRVEDKPPCPSSAMEIAR
ncbi:MAG TPA: hypothetical protein VGO71_06740 [Baekduia sp.]|nr:hypothetical protein [Baekduia sp.]